MPIISRREFVREAMGASLALLHPAVSRPQTRPQNSRPNIILIMSDDMGYSDIGCYGSEIDTQNLNRLAAGGLRLTQFYNCARCCATRASLMTGLYSHQVGVGLMTDKYDDRAYRGDLNDRCVTIAEALKEGGYHTLMCGKWHLTPPDSPSNRN